jgi:MFS family permease
MARDVTSANVPTASTRAGRPALGRPYWRLWTSAALSNLADGVFKIALPLVAIGFTRSPALIAGVALAFTMPWLLFALPAGAVADRLDRRRLMVGANTVRALLLAVLVLTVLLDAGSIWALYAVAFCAGTAETIYDTAAQSILPRLVPRDQLPRANARIYAAELTANEFAGPPLAGFLAAAGVVAALTVPAGLWAVAVVALLLVPGSFRIERREPATLRADIAEGLRFLWHNRLLRTFTVITGAFNFASSATFAILVLYAVGSASAMGLTAQAYGWLLSTVAAGGLAGSLVAERVVRWLGRARTLLFTLLSAAILVGLPGVTRNPLLIGAAFFLGGGGLIIFNVVMTSLRQSITPDRLLGRVNSSHRLVGWGTKPLGAAAGGLLGQALGLRPVFITMGLLSLAVLTGLTKVTDHAMDTAERRAGQA